MRKRQGTGALQDAVATAGRAGSFYGKREMSGRCGSNTRRTGVRPPLPAFARLFAGGGKSTKLASTQSPEKFQISGSKQIRKGGLSAFARICSHYDSAVVETGVLTKSER